MNDILLTMAAKKGDCRDYHNTTASLLIYIRIAEFDAKCKRLAKK